jgi:hypothetical protein
MLDNSFVMNANNTHTGIQVHSLPDIITKTTSLYSRLLKMCKSAKDGYFFS